MFRIVLFCTFLFSTQLTLASETMALHALFEEYWANEMEENPFSATKSGIFEFNDRVPSVSPADQERRLIEVSSYLDRLDAIDSADLSGEDQLNAELFAFILKHKVALAAFDEWRMPFLADSGFHTDFSYVVSATPFRVENDYLDYLKRLQALPVFIEQNIQNMRRGLADGFTQPSEILPFILPSFEAQVIADSTDHPYYAPFKAIPAAIDSDRKKQLKKQAQAVLSDSVIPAYARLLAFMRDEYVPNARDTLGASELPEGKARYEALIRYYTTLDDANADDIHELGLREVSRIREEMDVVIRDTGFAGNFAEFIAYLRNDKQFYAASPQQLLDRAAWIAKDIDGRLPAFFGKLPRQPYSVEPVPAEIAANYTNARYVGASLDADRGGQFWVNTYRHEIRPLYQLTAMALHEAVPGHHLQAALALEIDAAPMFRTNFYPHAFGEGWGLYAEKLGVEMGVYQNAYDQFGRLTWEMWRACRLVIDTGIHVKGWSRQEAIDYLASNTALALHNVQTEVDRYIAWPGQALAYKMGELTIWELREKAERELGESFDIREFHDAVVARGGLPLELLRLEIDDYITITKSKK
jgi:uncharacterized protein (DUF885 family)